MGTTVRYRRWFLGLVAVGAVLAVALWPVSVPVDAVESTRGPLVVTLDEEGETRVRQRYVVSAPVAGRVLRMELEPGDRVAKGDVVARLLAGVSPLLDARARAEAEAAVAVASASLGRAEAELRRVGAVRDLAAAELRRQRALAAAELASVRDIETAEADARAADESVMSAEFAVATARSQVQQAQARVQQRGDGDVRPLSVPAPVDGLVLRRLRESEAVVAAGEPLVELGNPARDLEIVADLLSTDAVRVRTGARVLVERWGGARTLEGRVRRVEPAGFTKVSALGVEEQRVNVLIDLLDPSDAWDGLGDGYRVEVRVIVWETADVVKVPTSALVRQNEGWAVFLIDGGRARLARVDIGERNAEEAEVRSGLAVGQQVIVHPGDQIAEGRRVQAR